MKRKAATKKPSSPSDSDVEPTPMNQAASQRFRKYLDPKFTDNLVKHMHRAKKAALKDKE